MRNPEALPNYPEFRPELEPERDLCLRSLLSKAVAPTLSGYNREDLFEGLNNAVVEANEVTGEYTLACQQSSCEASCVIVISRSGAEGTIAVQSLQTWMLACTKP